MCSVNNIYQIYSGALLEHQQNTSDVVGWKKNSLKIKKPGSTFPKGILQTLALHSLNYKQICSMIEQFWAKPMYCIPFMESDSAH